MVPVRSEEHTRVFLAGLGAKCVHVSVVRVDSAWVSRVVSPQRDAAVAASPLGTEQWPPVGDASLDAGSFSLSEGTVLFVQGQFM